MKKILLATTVLAMSAGYAAADITWGASARAGLASDAGADIETYSSANLAVTLSGTSDSGLTFGATFDMTTGRTYDFGDGDGFGNDDGAMGMPTIFVEGSFGKLAISDDNMDFYDDAATDSDGDVEYTGTFGAVNVGVMADVDSGSMAAKAGYTAGALALSADYNQLAPGADAGLVDPLWNVSATYTMGAIAITAATNEASDPSLKVAYSANGISASAQYNSSDESIDLAAGYSANGLSVNASTNTESNEWEVTGSYDLGGGLSVEAGTNFTEDMYIGAAMSF